MKRQTLLSLLVFMYVACTACADSAASVARYGLPNGLQVWHLPRVESQSVAVNLIVHTGSRFEDENQKGISHFLEHMCFEGTEKYGADEAKTIEIITSLGGVWNAQTGEERTSFWARVPARHFEQAVEWVAQLVFHPTFPEKKLEKVRSVIFEEKGGKSRWLESTLFAADVTRETRRALFPGSSLANSPIGKRQSLEGIGLADLIAYHDTYYTANNAILLVVGNVDAARVSNAVQSHFAGLPLGPPLAHPEVPPMPVTRDNRTVLHGWAVGRQGSVMLAARTPGVSSPDRAALGVLRVYLSHRLMKELHFNQGLAYDVAVHDEAFTDVGYLGVFARAKRTKLAKIEEVLKEELDRIRAGEINTEKVEDAKRALSGAWAMSTEGNPGWMNWLQQFTFALPLDAPLPDFETQVATVKPDDVIGMVKTCFTPDRMTVTVQRPPF